MERSTSFKKLLLKNIYLLLTAAWMITISFIIDNYWAAGSSAGAVLHKITAYVQAQENDFDTLVANKSLIKKLASRDYDDKLLRQLTEKKYFFFVYDKDELGLYRMLFWNTQVVEPDAQVLNQESKGGFQSLVNGWYVWRRQDVGNLTLLALIPVKWNYSITNEYLINSFSIGNGLENNFTISEAKNDNAVISKDGNVLFSLEQKIALGVKDNNIFAALLRIAAAIIVLMFVHIMAVNFVHRSFYAGVFFLIGTIVLLRLLSYFLPVPVNFRQYELFDPRIYAANAVFRSLGDLLINAILFLWIVLFIRHFMQLKSITVKVKNNFTKWLLVINGIIILLASVFICGTVIRSMVADSQISFDVVNFFTLNGYSVVGFLVLGCMAIGFFLLSQIVAYLLQPLFPKNIMSLILVVTIVGLVFLTFRINMQGVIFELYLLIWLLLYLLLLNTRKLYFFASSIVSSRLIFWLFFFSISIAAVIIVENNAKETEKQKHYAETLSTKADPASERLMNTVLTDFRSEVIAPLFYKLNSENSNKALKDSLLNNNFSGYLSNFETRIFTFDSNERPLYNQDSSTFITLTTILRLQGKPTAVPDLYYYDLSYDKFNYISKKDITDTTGKLLGYIFILATPKKYKTDALYPELFLKGYNASLENSPIYSFAVYNKLQLVSSHNDYAFPSHLLPKQLPREEFAQHTKSGYDELWYKAGPDKVVIIAKKDSFIIESITLFSYLFCAFLVVTGFFWLLNSLIRSRLKWSVVKQYWQMSIRNQVHATIIFMSLLSFIIVGVATILFFIDRYYNNNRENMSRTIKVMQNEVRNSLNELTVFDDVIKLYDLAYRDELEKSIARISEVNAVDINMYDLNGILKVSSLPLPYNKGIVSNLMDPEAYYHLHTLKEIQFFKNEKIGGLQYLSNYVPVLDGNGQQYAYLNIPYFTSQTKLRQEISNFLVAIMNLNAFIFLIAGVVALFITNRITRSFTFISNRMKQVNLGKINEAIKWKRKDEIGELVQEYNKMVAKLDESAAALAKSEREGAWREMARQVAHEIKNPLTPMKLSLQYLQKSIDNNAGNVTELSKNVARTLVEQIDHLSQIAGQFSQFANIGNPKNEVFDLNELIEGVTHLHGLEENLQLSWQPYNGAVMINADKTHINRLFTNLIQNAIQAVPENKTPQIDISEKIEGNKVLIVVKDNGHGIPEEMQSKIFTPNFTTKTSGTGLGLAMCKGIVEQSHGRIWFETNEGLGTSFFVELPLSGAN